MAKFGLTEIQQRAYNFIENKIFIGDTSPSYREIGNFLNLKSVSHVSKIIDALIARGYIIKENNCSRSLMITLWPSKKKYIDEIARLKQELEDLQGKYRALASAIGGDDD